ncbi:MAG: hypothetical protein HC880_13810 [Bacteroidia bacterium]|nr:hypothetical protein [Bacteroidia bacterium]
MAENTFKRKEHKLSAPTFPGKSLDLDKIVGRELSTRYIPRLIYLSIFGIMYIANAHYAERMVREISTLEAEVETLRANHTTIKAEYDTYTGKQSEIAERAKAVGLVESGGKVQKIYVNKDEY